MRVWFWTAGLLVLVLPGGVSASTGPSVYTFAPLEAVTSTLYFVEDAYVDPHRVDWEQLLNDGLAGAERSLTTFRFERDESAQRLRIQVGGAALERELAPLTSRRELMLALRWVSRFVKDNADSKDVVGAPGLRPFEGLEYAIVNGMLSSLDPYSRLLTPEQTASFRAETQGKRTGVGMILVWEGGWPVVADVIPDSPASASGLRAGDRLIEVDGRAAQGRDLADIERWVSQTSSATLSLVVSRGDHAEVHRLTVETEVLAVHRVEGRLLDGDVAWLRIQSFHDRVGREFASEIARLEREAGGVLRGVLLDLRGNPGGYVGQAVAVADTLLGSGIIVSQVGRAGRGEQKEVARSTGNECTAALIVLLDGGTASAAEIVAEAVRANDRGLLVGGLTYGKGSVQYLYPVGDVDLKLTVARYLTPTGQSIQARGVTPDVLLRPIRVRGSAGEPSAIRLFAGDAWQREEDVQASLLASRDALSEAVFEGVYLQDVDGERGADEVLLLARDVLLSAQGSSRLDLLRSARQAVERAERVASTGVAARMRAQGLAWADGVDRIQDTPALDVRLEWDSSAPAVAGEAQALTVTVRNEGADAVRGLVVHLEGASRSAPSVEVPIGDLMSGEETTRGTKIWIPTGTPDQAATLVLSVRDLFGSTWWAGRWPLMIETPVAPDLVWSWAAVNVLEQGITGADHLGVELVVKNVGADAVSGASFALTTKSTDVNVLSDPLYLGFPRTLDGVPCVASQREESGCSPRLEPGEEWRGRLDVLADTSKAPAEAFLDLHWGAANASPDAKRPVQHRPARELVRWERSASVEQTEPRSLPRIRVKSPLPMNVKASSVRLAVEVSDLLGVTRAAVVVGGRTRVLEDTEDVGPKSLTIDRDILLQPGPNHITINAWNRHGFLQTRAWIVNAL